jgi:hypothetical protein
VSDNGVPAEPRLASINRQQFVLRSIDVEQLIDEDGFGEQRNRKPA